MFQIRDVLLRKLSEANHGKKMLGKYLNPLVISMNDALDLNKYSYP